jgi:hypothetical protein
VALESVEREAAIDRALIDEEPQRTPEARAEGTEQGARDITEAAFAPVQGANIARGAHAETHAPVAATVGGGETETAAAEQQPPRKTDWL